MGAGRRCLEALTSPAVHGGSLGWGSGCGDADKGRDVQSVFGSRTVDFVGGLDWREEEWESHATVPAGQGGWVSAEGALRGRLRGEGGGEGQPDLWAVSGGVCLGDIPAGVWGLP